MTYQALFERAADGTFWGTVPELDGAFGSGDSLEEARVSLEEAARLWVEEARLDGSPVPPPSTVAVLSITVAT